MRDRVVQTAATLRLAPRFEADCAPDAYGVRPKRDAQQALDASREAVHDGRYGVIDADVQA